MTTKKRIAKGVVLMVVLLVLFIIPLISANKMVVYQANLIISNNSNVKLDSFTPIYSNWIDKSINTSKNTDYYTLRLLSSKKDVLYEVNFSADFIFYTFPPVYISKSYVSLNLPYLTNAKTLVVYHNGKKLLDTSVSKPDKCSHNVNCINSSTLTGNLLGSPGSSGNTNLEVGIVLLVIVLIAGYLLLRKNKKKKKLRK